MRREFSLLAALAVAWAVLPVPSVAAAPVTAVEYKLTADRKSADAAHPVVKITGIVTVKGKTTPVVGQRIALATDDDPRAKFETGTTDDAGQFTASYTPSGSAKADVYVIGAPPPGMPDVSDTGSTVVQVQVTTAATALTVAADRTTADLNQAIVLGGRLTSGGKGLAKTEVRLTGHGIGACKPDPVAATTDADGGFKTTVRPSCKIDKYLATAVPDGLYKPATAETAALTIRDTPALGLTVKIGATGRVKVSGAITPAAATSLTLEYSAGGKKSWRKIKTVTTSADGAFTRSFTYKHSGYWRVRHGGIVSPVAKALRTPTRVIKFKLSTKKTRYKKKLTLSGLLQRKTGGKWKGYSKRTLDIYFTCKDTRNKSVYLGYRTVRTNTKGRFSKRIPAYCTGRVYVTYDGGTTAFSTTSKKLNLTVTGAPKVVDP